MEGAKVIPPSDYDTLKQIVGEYLPGTDLLELEKMCGHFPSVVTGYYIDGRMIGVCYGYGIDRENFALDGIAIIEPYNKADRGGILLAFFEQGVSALGYNCISLGSANGYVERFYLKHGYKPVELKIYVDSNEWEGKLKDCIYPVAYTETEGKRTKLAIKVTDYRAMNQEEIREYYGGASSFFVFEKRVQTNI